MRAGNKGLVGRLVHAGSRATVLSTRWPAPTGAAAKRGPPPPEPPPEPPAGPPGVEVVARRTHHVSCGASRLRRCRTRTGRSRSRQSAVSSTSTSGGRASRSSPPGASADDASPLPPSPPSWNGTTGRSPSDQSSRIACFRVVNQARIASSAGPRASPPKGGSEPGPGAGKTHTSPPASAKSARASQPGAASAWGVVTNTASASASASAETAAGASERGDDAAGVARVRRGEGRVDESRRAEAPARFTPRRPVDRRRRHRGGGAPPASSTACRRRPAGSRPRRRRARCGRTGRTAPPRRPGPHPESPGGSSTLRLAVACPASQVTGRSTRAMTSATAPGPTPGRSAATSITADALVPTSPSRRTSTATAAVGGVPAPPAASARPPVASARTSDRRGDNPLTCRLSAPASGRLTTTTARSPSASASAGQRAVGQRVAPGKVAEHEDRRGVGAGHARGYVLRHRVGNPPQRAGQIRGGKPRLQEA